MLFTISTALVLDSFLFCFCFLSPCVVLHPCQSLSRTGALLCSLSLGEWKAPSDPDWMPESGSLQTMSPGCLDIHAWPKFTITELSHLMEYWTPAVRSLKPTANRNYNLLLPPLSATDFLAAPAPGTSSPVFTPLWGASLQSSPAPPNLLHCTPLYQVRSWGTWERQPQRDQCNKTRT